ncbi:hypothetical protein O0L34_g5746 [Tuta absoluta]|nr:hypothetical protein O0L34_g5746 [Tuta absoluta]
MTQIYYNATNSIGLIYEKSYTPKDGLFHVKNDAWRMANYDILKTTSPTYNQSVRNGIQLAVDQGAAQPLKYELATVDNFLYHNWTQSPQLQHQPPIGIGILPLLSSDGAHESSILNIMVEVGITIETTSHGQNILMGQTQPNPLIMGYRITDHKFSEIFIGNQPITSITPTQLEVQPHPTPTEIVIAGMDRTRREAEFDDTEIRNAENQAQQAASLASAAKAESIAKDITNRITQDEAEIQQLKNKILSDEHKIVEEDKKFEKKIKDTKSVFDKKLEEINKKANEAKEALKRVKEKLKSTTTSSTTMDPYIPLPPPLPVYTPAQQQGRRHKRQESRSPSESPDRKKPSQ